MGGLELEQLLGNSISHTSETELEKLYSGLNDVGDDVEEQLESRQLMHLFLLAQHVMRAKQEQLSVAVEELEKLAETAGEDEELKQRNAELQKLVNKYKTKSTDARGVDLRVEVDELQTARNQLRKDLKAKHRQLDDEKRENDKLMSRLEEAESERRELRRQLDQLNETMDDMRRTYDSRSDPEEVGEHQYAELIRQKNQYINVLLDDVEAHDRESSEMKSQVASLRDQLRDATQQIETMTAEFEEFRKQARPATLQHEGGGSEAETQARQRLEVQVAELQAVKARRDRQFDQLSTIVEQRTEEFKRLIASRDAEIETLQAELKQVNAQLTSSDVDCDRRRLAELQQQCEQQRRQLSAQQADLRRATTDMEATAQLLEQNRLNSARPGDDPARTSLLAVRADLARSEAQVRQLSEQLEHTERQAAEYNDQVTELTARLREVMEGEFGLTEAVADIKERQRQIDVRDRQVAEQNQYINLVQRHLTELVDENTALRTRLGMEPHEAAQLVQKHSGKEKLVNVLEREVEKLEEERIALKLENRKLSRQMRSGGQTGLTADEIRHICRQRKEFWDYVKRLGSAPPPADWQKTPASDVFQRLANLETELVAARDKLGQSERATAQALSENDKLRQGMREILQSIREQDAVSAVKVAAPSLEALLQAMDTRGLVGEYHAALVPYSMLQQLEGKNAELRDQLRAARAEARGSANGAPAAAGSHALEVLSGRLQLPAHVTASSGHVVGQLTSQLMLTLKALDDARGGGQQIRTELEGLRQKFSMLRHQMALQYQQRAEDVDRWQSDRRALESRAEQAEADNQEVRAQLQALETGALALQSPPDEQRASVAEAHRQMAVRVSELLRCERRLRLAVAERDSLSEKLRRAERDEQQARLAVTNRIASLKADKAKLEFQLSVLQKELEASAPLAKVTEVNDKVDQVTAKYATILSKQDKLLGEERTCRLLEAEVTHLRQQLTAQRQPTVDQPAADETTLRAQLAEMTSREQQQRQSADHAHRMAHLLKEQLAAAESRAAELETRAAELAEAGAAGRLALARLADQLTEPPAAANGCDSPDLKRKLVELEGERDRLKGTFDLATSQLEYLRAQRDAAEAVTVRLKAEWAGLQEKDDLRAVIASLHQRLLTVERSEAELQHQLATAKAALTSAETRIYQAETDAANARVQMSGLRTTHAKRIRTVRCVVQELRGCLSLPQRALQERLCESLADLLSHRQTLLKQLSVAQEARDAAEGERDGVRAQRRLLDEALTGLKDGGAAVRPWMERCQNTELEVTSLRLRAERLKTECEHVHSQLAEEERRATDAESTICRLKNELELRFIDQQLETRSVSGSVAASPQPAAGSVGHSRLPVRTAHRPGSTAASDTAVDTRSLKDACGRHAAAVRALMTSLADRHDVAALERRLAAALDGPSPAVQLLIVSADVIRLRAAGDCPPSPPPAAPRQPSAPYEQSPEPRPEPRARRGTWTEPTPAEPTPAVALEVDTEPDGAFIEPCALLTEPGAAISGAEDLCRERRLRVAETAAASLRQRLEQKEHSLADCRRLLGQTRRQMAELAERHEQERARAGDELRQQLVLVASLQAENSARETPVSGNQLSGSQLSRLHESAELLAEQERAIGALMERLRQSREEEARYRERVHRLETERRDTAEVLGRTVATLAAKRAQLRDQLIKERRQAAALTEARMQAQAALVGRLREIMLKKERQHHALARVLRELKAEIVQTVEEAALAEQKPERGGAADPARTARTRVEDGLRGQLAAAERQLDEVKNDLNERTLQCHRLQADQHEADRRRREDTQRLQRQLEAVRQKLRAAEQSQTTARAKPQADPQKIQEELAKWEERKRWQRAAERLRCRLKEKEAECERQQALGAGLRDTIHRLEREKAGYEAKIRTLTGMMSEDRYLALEQENEALREEAAQLRSTDAAECGHTVEKLRHQVHTLTTKLAEQRAATRRGKGAASNVARYEAELAQLRALSQQLEEQNGQLKAEIAELRRTREAADAGGGDASAGSGDADVSPSAPTAPPAAAEHGTVAILRRLVERLRAENLRLRRELLRHTVTSTTEEQVDILKQELHRAVAERDNLASQLQRLRSMELRLQ